MIALPETQFVLPSRSPEALQEHFAYRDYCDRLSIQMLHSDADCMQMLASCSGLICTGGGYINDVFKESAQLALALCEYARARSKPYVLLGQGFGPFDADLHTLHRLLEILQFASLTSTRAHDSYTRTLCRHIFFIETCDYALPLTLPAYAEESVRTHVGVNIRCAKYAGISAERAGEITGEIASLLHAASFQALPISHCDFGSYSRPDADMLEALHCRPCFPDLNSIVRATSECKYVITGSYHAGVFALGQGLPIVALCASEYYEHKWHGLAAAYWSTNQPCVHIIDVTMPDWRQKLANAIAFCDAFTNSEQLRVIRLNHMASQDYVYSKLKQIFQG